MEPRPCLSSLVGLSRNNRIFVNLHISSRQFSGNSAKVTQSQLPTWIVERASWCEASGRAFGSSSRALEPPIAKSALLQSRCEVQQETQRKRVEDAAAV